MKNHKKLIKSKYPQAHIFRDLDYNVFVCVPELGEDYAPAAELFYPLTDNEDTAWEYANLCLRITQNFNRTHPDRMKLDDFEEKMTKLEFGKNYKDDVQHKKKERKTKTSGASRNAFIES